MNAKLAPLSIHQRGRTHRRQEAPLNGVLCCEACGAPMSQSYTTKAGRRYRYYGCQAARAKGGKSCSQGPVAAIDIEASIRKQLEPVLGGDLDWSMIHEAVREIRYEAEARRVVIYLEEGTHTEYELPLPNRRGAGGWEKTAPAGRVPRISRLMALAIKFERLIGEGEVRNYRALAEAGQISRARLTQIMRLTELAPSIQEKLLFLPKTLAGPDRVTEKGLRKVVRSIDWEHQKRLFEALKRR